MKTLAITLAFTVMATAAYAGGNPDEEDFGVGTRDPLPQATPVIPNQYEIQEQVEREIFAKPQLKSAIVDEPEEKPVQIVRAEPKGECAAFWQAAADLFGGPCYLDSNFHNPSPVGNITVMGTKEVERTDRFKGKFGKGFRGFKRAVHKARDLKKNGYRDVRISYSKKYGFKVTGTKTYTEQVKTFTRVRADSVGGNGGGTADSSNGMRGNDIDSGNW